MFSKIRLRPRSELISSRRENRPSSADGNENEATIIEIGRGGKPIEHTILTGSQESKETRHSSSNGTNQSKGESTEINGKRRIDSVIFLDDGKHIVSGDWEGSIRRWRIEDGKEVGTPMGTGSAVCNIAVSQDGKWIVSGTTSGEVTVWDVENHKKEAEFQGHHDWVRAVDMSSDATKIATGSTDKTACVWSLLTGERLFDPLEHNDWVATVKFSPDGRRVATTTWCDSVRIYDSENGRLLVEFSLKIDSPYNQSLAWASDNKRLFALSHDGNINCLDVTSGTTLSQWPIHSSNDPKCIVLSRNGIFIAASANSSVSFWDTTTHKQIGTVIEHTNDIVSMAISANYDLAMGGGKTITLRSLCDVLTLSCFDILLREQELQRMKVEKSELERTIKSLRVQEEGSNERIVNLAKTVRELRNQLADAHHVARQKEDTYNTSIQSFRVQESNSNGTIADMEESVQFLHAQLADYKHKADCLVELLHVHEQKHRWETLYAEGHIIDAAVSLREIRNNLSENVRANKFVMDWFADFTYRCVTTLERAGDEALNAKKYDESLETYATALFLSPSTPDILLIKWASTMLVRGSVDNALSAATKFKLPTFVVYRTICDVLERDSRVSEAIKCFRQMRDVLGEDTGINDERVQWEVDFQQRCGERLEKLGDVAMDTRSYNKAVEHFSTLLSLNPADRMAILIKRSNARASMNSWQDALGDADEAIKLDSSCHRGYEQRHAVLHGARRYEEAVEAYYTMLSKLDQSTDGPIRDLRSRYVDATPTIRDTIEQTIRHMPQILIDVTTGRLYGKKQQAKAFETLPIYNELVSSMTKELDRERIRNVVKEFYRYVMFSHRWQSNEPTFQLVENMSIYKLPASPANSKLQNFCMLVRSLGLQWAWSDTCCVNQLDKGVQQESLVAMFRWYRGSSLTVVHLLGVSSKSQRFGTLWKSIWNTRGWTYQEYIASQIVQFYTEDWKPYLGLDMSNHKESPTVLSEMERAMNFATQELASLRPGLDRVREKLYLASKRETTREEDIAYSLFGIFNVAIPVIYGEGNQAVGRLLEHVLTGSGDATILAWTGIPGGYNSCLPSDLTVYDQIVPPHVPRLAETAEMDHAAEELRSSLADLSPVIRLYNRLNELPSPSLAASRLRLPGIAFRLMELVHISGPDPVTNLYVYHATTSSLGDLGFKTVDNLTGMKDLYIIHPWIRPLLDQEFLGGAAALDKITQALRLAARLRQPFGALLFTSLSRVEHKRVAADSLIMVQIRDDAPLTDLIDNIRTIEAQ